MLVLKSPHRRCAKFKFLLAILNSTLQDFYFKQISQSLGRKGYRYIDEFIEQLPIRQASARVQKGLANIVDHILSISEQYGYPLSNGASAKIKELEHQIDQMVYELYGLTDEEIRVVENFNRGK